ncbi:SsrA-binding protein SmpB [Enterobacteriaceae endosymbiont of Donacia bicoloricornis]|uniref:SsrA-binding protein SmpB n=1 Tax=Enterobacteriaceae endosymbiont of Donacia bicoloricornis TaxID=2675772 RepID=UPI0014492B3E|nr:SsrA-binding protein SmpB [Enterobacteriaceae endosymbiont of Donacia bicoloricornis]
MFYNGKKKYIIFNKKIFYNFFIEKKLNAGLVLQGWEVKSLRLKQVTIINSYISFLYNKVFVFNLNINPIITVCNHTKYDINRKKQLLLKKKEIELLKNYISLKNYTVVVMGLFWKKSWCKLKIAVVKGKKKYDKRNILKNKEWNFNKLRFLKKNI